MSESKYEIKVGTFSLFKNEKKTADNNQPHYIGNGKDLNGNDFQVSAWLTTSKSGIKYFSCKLQEPYNANNSNNNEDNAASVETDLPF